jgi:archaellum component FlaC
MRLTILVFICALLLTYPAAQAQSVRTADSIVLANSNLKMEVLYLKKRVNTLETKVKSLEGNLSTLTRQINTLTGQKKKTAQEFKRLEDMARSLLDQNDSLNVSNRELAEANSRIKNSKESVEVAARALRDVLQNERDRTKLLTESFKKNFARGCTNLTHVGRQGIVKLDEENVHKLSWIDNFTLTANTCFALPREEATNNVKVYFSLYRQDDLNRNAPIESNVPIILTPNLNASDDTVVYYEGTLTVALPAESRRALKTSFVYEVVYLEQAIAVGKFKLD